MVKKKVEALLCEVWIEELKLKWDSELYYYDEAEAEKIYKFCRKLKNDRKDTKS